MATHLTCYSRHCAFLCY